MSANLLKLDAAALKAPVVPVIVLEAAWLTLIDPFHGILR